MNLENVCRILRQCIVFYDVGQLPYALIIRSGPLHATQKLASSLTLQWRHNGHNGVQDHQLHHSLLNRLFRRRSKKRSKLRVTGLCVGNSPGTGEFPAQMASNAKNASIWWRHHEMTICEVPLSKRFTYFTWEGVIKLRWNIGERYGVSFNSHLDKIPAKPR